MTVRVGLTGGIGSGKSTVAALLAGRGAVVIDADAIAREVVAPGTPGLADVVEEFGREVLTAQGELDRPRMGALVFADAEARRRLEAIVHPLVLDRIVAIEAAAAAGDVVVQDIPLLVEGGRVDTFDAVVVVDVPTEVQVQRLVRDRGMSDAEAQARLDAQATREERLAVATYVVDNSGSVEELQARVDEVWAELGTAP